MFEFSPQNHLPDAQKCCRVTNAQNSVTPINKKKNKVSTLKKIWADATLKTSRVAPYKNVGRF